jgi:hypothetical protein
MLSTEYGQIAWTVRVAARTVRARTDLVRDPNFL